ncbi:hypothetical protein G5I_05310 [Acromyrmex echinatior]|uniref:Uncharacterized protein n=1 Tax=Acromyrmex echinatior TaxID=103372 RepID=F4WHW3_ACREC|nr:hypothetical protein G5I_05310 [Acromyrmex echinatior]
MCQDVTFNGLNILYKIENNLTVKTIVNKGIYSTCLMQEPKATFLDLYVFPMNTHKNGLDRVPNMSQKSHSDSHVSRVSSCGASREAAVSSTLRSVATPRARLSARVPFTRSAPSESPLVLPFLSPYLFKERNAIARAFTWVNLASAFSELYPPSTPSSIKKAIALSSWHRMSGSSASPDKQR